MNDRFTVFEVLRACRLTVVTVIVLANSPIAVADSAGHATVSASSQDLEQTLLPLVFRVLARDMFSAGLDELSEKQMRMFLSSALKARSEQDKLLSHFASTWLDAEREIDKLKREMVCANAADRAESTEAVGRILGLSKALELVVYTKHFVMQEARLLIAEQIELRAVLLDYPVSRTQLLAAHNQKINQTHPDAIAEVKRFCTTPWQYEFMFRQPDGTNRRHRIEL